MNAGFGIVSPFDAAHTEQSWESWRVIVVVDGETATSNPELSGVAVTPLGSSELTEMLVLSAGTSHSVSYFGTDVGTSHAASATSEARASLAEACRMGRSS